MMEARKFYVPSTLLCWCVAQVVPRTCHYCNVITDIWDPLNRTTCDAVKKELMKNGSLYTTQCPHNEYCMYYKGMYKHGYFTPEFYAEFGGCSGKEEEIYIGGEKGPGNTNGTFVGWKTIKRNGTICLSLIDKSCFEWKSTNTAIVAGVVVGVLIVILIPVIGVAVWLVKAKRRRGDGVSERAEPSTEVSASPGTDESHVPLKHPTAEATTCSGRGKYSLSPEMDEPHVTLVPPKVEANS